MISAVDVFVDFGGVYVFGLICWLCCWDLCLCCRMFVSYIQVLLVELSYSVCMFFLSDL